MYEIIFLLALGLIWIIFASIQDLKSREVPNWLGFSLITFALGFRFFYGIFNEDFGIFFQGLIGLAIFFVIGNVFYYLRLFAGGDAKLMIALGAILPIFPGFYDNLKVYSLFIFLFFLAGAVYGLILTLGLSLRNFRVFRKDFFKRIRKNKRVVIFTMAFGIILGILGIFEDVLFSFGVLLFVFPYFYFYAKAVDETCMVKRVKVSDLREGDWIIEDLKVGKKVIRPSCAGISKLDISLIKKKYRHVKIKQGIPFIPVFLIAFLVLIWLWNKGLWNALW